VPCRSRRTYPRGRVGVVLRGCRSRMAAQVVSRETRQGRLWCSSSLNVAHTRRTGGSACSHRPAGSSGGTSPPTEPSGMSSWIRTAAKAHPTAVSARAASATKGAGQVGMVRGAATLGRAHPPWRWLMLLGSPPAVAALPGSCQSIPRSGVASQAERWLAMSPTVRRQPPVSRETRRGARRAKYAGDGLMRQAPPACRRRGPVDPASRRLDHKHSSHR
jgi:hypothetical protein